MKVIIKEDRKVIVIANGNTEIAGIQNENKVEKIDFEYPEKLSEYNMVIFFKDSSGHVDFDVVQNNEYIIERNVTVKGKVDCQIAFMNAEVTQENLQDEDTLVFESKIFPLVFGDSIIDGADELIPDEQVSLINTLIDQLNAEIEEVDGLNEEVTEALDTLDEKITEVNNLDIDANKVDKIATVEVTKKNGTVKTVQIADGISLQFMWQGTRLGIKTEDQQEYTFVDLQGVQGEKGDTGAPFTIKKTYSSVAEMIADFDNMELGDYVMIASTVELEDNAKLYTRGEIQWIYISDFSGSQGIKGETGTTPNIQIGNVTEGQTPAVTRTGTNENPILNFTLKTGATPNIQIGNVTEGNNPRVTRRGTNENPILDFILKTGATGNGIANIAKTSTSGLVDTYTITYTDGTTTTFTVTNGKGITSVEKISSVDTVDTYRITFNDGSTFDYTVTNGEVTQTQLDEVIEELERTKTQASSELETASAEGESLDLSGCANWDAEMDIEGNSKQETTEGYNVMDIIPLTPITSKGITFTPIYKENGSLDYINVNGTATGDVTYPLMTGKTISAGTYHLSGCPSGGSTGSYYIYSRPGGGHDTGTGANLTYEEDTTMTDNNIRITIISGTTINNQKWYPMLVSGTTPKDYEPYTGTIPSPNPNYKQPIKSVGDNVNEFDGIYENTYTAGSSPYKYTSSNTARTGIIKVKPNTTYTITKEISNRFRISQYTERPVVETSNAISYIQAGDDKTEYTLTTNSDTQYLAIQVTNESQDNIKMKVEEGTKATPWSPYGMGCISEIIHNDNIIDTTTFVNGQLNTDGSVTNVQYRITSEFILVKENSNYYVDWNYSDDNLYLIYSTYDENKNHIARTIPNSKTIATTVTTKYIKICLSRTVNQILNVSDISNFMLSSSQHDYIEPKSQSYTIPTQQPIRSIGDVRDGFVETQSGWVERHYINRKIFDGVSNKFNYKYSSIYSDEYGFYQTTLVNKKHTSNTSGTNYGKSNYFKYYDGTAQQAFNSGSSLWWEPSTDYNYATMPFTTLNDVNDWVQNKYNEGKPFYIDYLLSTPTDLPCTPAQTAILNEIKKKMSTYQGVTHIYSEDDVPAYLEVGYKKSTYLMVKELINN